MPEALFHLGSLRELYLCDMPLLTLPIPKADVPHIVMLNLADNPKLTLPPGALLRFTGLRSLILDGYAAAQFPNDVLQLRALKQLSLDRTQFKQLPSAICELERLGQLSLDNAQLSTLPSSLAAHANLIKAAAKLNFMGLKIANNPFSDKALRTIAKMKNPDRTLQALAWAGEHGCVEAE